MPLRASLLTTASQIGKRAINLDALHRPGVAARRFVEDADDVDAGQRAAARQADEAFGAVGHAEQQDVAHGTAWILVPETGRMLPSRNSR